MERVFNILAFWYSWGIVTNSSPHRLKSLPDLSASDPCHEFQQQLLTQVLDVVRRWTSRFAGLERKAGLNRSSVETFLADFVVEMERLDPEDEVRGAVDELWQFAFRQIQATSDDVFGLVGIAYYGQS